MHGGGIAPNERLGIQAALPVLLMCLISPNGKSDCHWEVMRKYEKDLIHSESFCTVNETAR